ncbi:sporulation protein YqfD, partial [Pseudoflavonifractor phocaeensis]|uniref:sporulation protein YqfD n=1 Tax=Pseudoflavonifractor phocaeensis TaxID=1870988 RepID=UPI001F273E8E
MKRLMNFLRGMVTLTVTGPFPERLINLCAQEEIDFWAVTWLDMNTLRLTTRRRTLALLRSLAERVGCQVQVEGSRGLPDFLLRFRKRYAFLVGLTLSLCAVAVLSRFVLTIEVTGNERVPTAVILTQLRQLGVKPGVYGPSIERQQVAQEALLELEELSWMGINLHGTRLEVIVRERIPAPKRIDETGYYDIVAEADGIITQVEAELGDAVVQEGDTVLAGETLISGTVTMEPPQYSDQPTRYYQTHARGRVWARTWRTLTAAIPLQAEVKEYTGESRRGWTLGWMGRRWTLW